jgi:type I restriction-modification system DNA methylase subunit
LWAATDILRGSLDPADYRQPIMTLLFIKRLNDTFEEHTLILFNKERAKEVVCSVSDNSLTITFEG